jgi:hypothetical protein
MAALYVRPNFADLVVVTQDTTGSKEAFYHDHVDKISVMNTEGSLKLTWWEYKLTQLLLSSCQVSIQAEESG